MYVRLDYGEFSYYFTYKFFNRFHDLIFWSFHQICCTTFTIVLDCDVPSGSFIIGSSNICSMPSSYILFLSTLFDNLADSSSVPFPALSPFEAPF